MKKTSAILAAVLFTASVFLTDQSSAQTPQKMNYQSVIRNSSNALITSSAIGMKISILQNSANGAAVYVETQKPTTNANGLATIEIGSGTVVFGVFSGIDWSAGPYYLKVQTDPGGGTNYTITGTSQLLSVPYALYSASGGTLTGITATPPLSSSGGTAPDISLSGTVPVANLPSLAGDATGNLDAVTVVKLQNRNLATTAPTNGQVLAYNLGNSQWEPQNISSSGNSSGWSLSGNTGTTVGTNFIGTTDAQPLMFKVNNQKAGYIDFASPFNTGFGNDALKSNTTGYKNTAIGFQALENNTTGNNNTAIGLNALISNTTGYNNTAIGLEALISNTTGNYNTADGMNALYNNSTGSFNTATGQGALQNNTTGSYNAAHGQFALLSNTTGGWNTASGQGALQNNTTGNYNSASGQGALVSNTTGNNNTASGQGALQFNTTGNFNSANGQGALQSNTTGSYNSAHGQFALLSNTTGTNNTATGQGALQSNTTGSYNSAHGQAALLSNTTGAGNTATGPGALQSNTTGGNNTATGTNALHDNTTGDYNTATGSGSLQINTAGYQNTANGYSALLVNTTGNNNVANGYYSLSANTTGYQNIANGSYALQLNTTGYDNAANGYQSLKSNTTGTYNVANGYGALLANTTASWNTAIGTYALTANTTGPGNTAVGYYSLFDNVTGDYNTAIGYHTGEGGSTHNSVFIGYDVGSLYIGPGFDNSVMVGNNYQGWIGGNVSWSTYSDERIKDNVKTDVPGLAFISLLKPVTYNLNTHRQYEITHNGRIDTVTWATKYDSEKVRTTGFLAQQVAEAAKQAGYDFSGVHKPGNPNGLYSLSYSDFVMPLVIAVQELSVKNDTLKNQNNELAFKVNDLQNQIDVQQTQIDNLKTQNIVAMKQFDDLKTQLEAEVEAIKNSLFPQLAKK